jgi:hypothetical protein
MLQKVLLLCLGLAGGACGSDPPSADEGSDPQDESGESSEEGETGEPPALGDHCEDTTLLIEAPTTLEATLRNATPDEDASAVACGLTGPTVFVEVTVHDRVDLQVTTRGRAYTPKHAVMLPGCSADPSRILACGETLPVTLQDIGPSLELLIAVGIDEADPALELPAPSDEDDSQIDPLDFELRLEAHAVLAEHALCGPGYGRCEPGTVCLPADEEGIEIDRCRRPEADSCVAPGTLVVPSPGAAVLLEIAPDEPHSDAHEHVCTGWRRPERVDRLVLPDGLGQTATLSVVADDPRVGLALRGPDCLPENALACAPATGSGDETSLSFAAPGQLAALATAPEGPLLFVELPREDDADPPATIHVSVEIFE